MILKRAGSKGVYVLYPKEWDKRWLGPEGTRYQTPCDMVLGGCSCGRHHQEGDDLTDHILDEHGADIEPHREWRDRQPCMT